MTTTILPVVELWLSFNGTAVLALFIDCPSRLLNARSLLLILSSGYDLLGYAIYGREGYLSRSEAGPPIDDYTAGIAAHSYYFISEGLKLECQWYNFY